MSPEMRRWSPSPRLSSGCLRASDVLGRWGGDEFLVILPGITEHHVGGHRRQMQGAGRPVYGAAGRLRIQVTISVGAAMVAAGDSAESLLNRADQHLYGLSKQLEAAGSL